MELSYTIYDPTKNITMLVTTPVPRELQAAAAAQLMRLHPEVEQVGYLEPASTSKARIRLQMMGGEFCGNATMSTAAHLAAQDKLPAGRSADLPLEVSGADGILTCHLENAGEFCLGTVAMPLPTGIGSAVLPPWESRRSFPAVTFPGIVHCIVPADELTREQAEREIRPQFAQLCRNLNTDACGILLFDESASAFAPYVYVASTDTAVWESGCGSGSAALGAYLTWRSAVDGSGTKETVLRQPGGTIRVRAGMEGGRFTSLTIMGKVQQLGSGRETLRL